MHALIRSLQIQMRNPLQDGAKSDRRDLQTYTRMFSGSRYHTAISVFQRRASESLSVLKVSISISPVRVPELIIGQLEANN